MTSEGSIKEPLEPIPFERNLHPKKSGHGSGIPEAKPGNVVYMQWFAHLMSMVFNFHRFHILAS